ncbi:MAG: Ig-like domain-containing protein [Clostridiales bacterium]|nr:Ig-like domain-containing protein [Clostridiales bacterium]
MKRSYFSAAAVLLIFLLAFHAFAEGHAYRNDAHWHDVSADAINLKYQNGDKFIVMYYSDSVSDCDEIGNEVVLPWMTTFDADIFGVDCEKYDVPDWIYSSLAAEKIYLPVVSFVENGAAYRTYMSNTYTVQKALNGIFTDFMDIVHVEGISLDYETLYIYAGGTTTVTATVYPENAANKTVIWSSDNTDIASVSTSGEITGVSEGSAVITATTLDGDLKAECTVFVRSPFVRVSKVTVSPEALTLKKGETKYLTANVFPPNATDKTVKWSSSDNSVAAVSDKGAVTGVNDGTAIISALSSDGKHSGSCAVTVSRPYVGVTDVKLSRTELTLNEGDEVSLTAIVSPPDATNKAVKWSSSDSYVATVSSGGSVKGLHAGTAVITASSSDGKKSDHCAVTVKASDPVIDAYSVLVSPSSLSLKINETATLTAEVIPFNASDKTVTWYSGDPSVVTVTDKGTVRACAAGTALVFARLSSGKEASCAVTVTADTSPEIPKHISVCLSETSLIYRSSSTASVSESIPKGFGVRYYSSDENVVSVNAESGKIFAAGKGTAEITAVVVDGSGKTVTDENGDPVTDSVTVTVGYSRRQLIIIIFFFGWLWYI